MDLVLHATYRQGFALLRRVVSTSTMGDIKPITPRNRGVIFRATPQIQKRIEFGVGSCIESSTRRRIEVGVIPTDIVPESGEFSRGRYMPSARADALRLSLGRNCVGSTNNTGTGP